MEYGTLPRMTKVIHRIERAIGHEPESAIRAKTERIASLSQAFFENEQQACKNTKQVYDRYNSWPREHKNAQEFKEEVEVVFTAYLFAQNKALYRERTGSLTHFNNEQEHRQMEAVVRGLVGQHQQIDTGQGKTSVILPITTLVSAYTSPESRVIFSSDSALRTEEFEQFAGPLAKTLEKAGLAKVEIVSKNTEMPWIAQRKDLKKQMEKEALVDRERGNEYRPEIKDQIHAVSQNIDAIELRQQALKKLEREKRKGIPLIETMTHDELVHMYQQNPQLLTKTKTPIYMDEAHAPFDRGTPYELVAEDSLAFSPDQVRRATAEWVLHYVVGHKMITGDTRIDGGVGMLTVKGEEKFALADIEHVFNSIHFKQALGIIAGTYGIEMEEIENTVQQSIQDLFQAPGGNQGQKNDQFGEYMSAIAQKTAQLFREQEKIYTVRQDGTFTLRDRYQDELLSQHEYNRELSLVARGIAGSFKIILPRVASSALTFPTFIHKMGAHIVCYSGTLKDEGKNSEFGEFLEKETGQKIYTAETGVVKHIPEPILVDTRRGSAEDRLITELSQDERGMLIISTESLREVRETALRLKRQWGEDMVVFIESKPSGNIEEERRYDAFVRTALNNLAEGKIRAIVSTGSVGVGMNIMKKDGSAPDIKVGILGIPQSKLQLKQVLGRRRAKESSKRPDYYWVVDHRHIDEGISSYKSHHSGLLSKLYDIDQSEVRAEYHKVKRDPVRLKSFIFKIIKKGQADSDTRYQIEYDKYYQATLREFRQIVENELLKKEFGFMTKEGLRPASALRLEQMVNTIGVPSSLYQDMQLLLGSFAYDPGNIKSHMVQLHRIVSDMGYVKEQAQAWIDEVREAGLTYVDTVLPLEDLAILCPPGYGRGSSVYIDSSAVVDPSLGQLIPTEGNMKGMAKIITVREPGAEDYILAVSNGRSAWKLRRMDSTLLTVPKEIGYPKGVSFGRMPVPITYETGVTLPYYGLAFLSTTPNPNMPS